MLLLLSACTGGSHDTVSEKQTEASGMQGISVEQPVDMQTVKADSSFLWLSNGDALRQRHLCIYSYEGQRLDAMELFQKRDSVMQRHIKGATDSIYMVTVKQSVSHATVQIDGTPKLKLSGLWQMENDAMGGPFVSYAVVDTLRGRIVVADGFVYAPGKQKETMMQRLEEKVRTISIKNK